jgi:TatD DNase family protein
MLIDTPSLIDTHCHLDFPDFEADRADIIARAKTRGVARMITISTRVRKFAQIVAIAESDSDIYCSVGTHPHQAFEETDVTVDELIALSAHPKCVAIGEAGLDYHYDKAPRDLQNKGLRVHIEAARRTGLPLVIHSRSADEDMANLLEEEMNRGKFTAIMHCFSSGTELAERSLALGFYLSFSGILTFKASTELREIAKSVPIDRLLVETDAPYLAPMPNRGKRNEPSFVADTAAVLADVKGVSFNEIARITTQNAERLFSKMGKLPIALENEQLASATARPRLCAESLEIKKS